MDNSKDQETSGNLNIQTIDLRSVDQTVVEEIAAFVAAEKDALKEYEAKHGFKDEEAHARNSDYGQLLIYGLGQLRANLNSDGKLFVERNSLGVISGLGTVTLATENNLDKHENWQFFGRSFDQKGQGIATGILAAQNKYIRSQGINKYTTTVTEESERVFKRLGCKYQVLGKRDQLADGTKILVNL